MNGKRLAWRVAAVVAGAGLYLAVVGSVGPWAVVQGLVVAAGALAVARPQVATLRAGSWRLLGRVAARSARDVIAGSWKVGLVAAGLRPVPEPAWVEVRVGEPPLAHAGALALLETFSPGTFLAEHDEERGVMIFHVFDAADAPGLRRQLAPALGAAADETGEPPDAPSPPKPDSGGGTA